MAPAKGQSHPLVAEAYSEHGQPRGVRLSADPKISELLGRFGLREVDPGNTNSKYYTADRRVAHAINQTAVRTNKRGDGGQV